MALSGHELEGPPKKLINCTFHRGGGLPKFGFYGVPPILDKRHILPFPFLEHA